MDVIKKVLAFSGLGDYLYFESKEEIEFKSFQKLYRFNSKVVLYYLLATAMFLAAFLIPFVNIIAIFIFYFFIFAYLIFIVFKRLISSILIINYYNNTKKLNLNDKEKTYLKFSRLSSIIYIVNFIIVFIFVICLFMGSLVGMGIFGILMYIAVIIRVVLLYMTRIKLYNIIKEL